jgi:hypothetical protein
VVGTGPREGEFALLRKYTDWEGLAKICYFRDWGL